MVSERQVTVDAVLLMYAFRYALGRRSYAPTQVAEALREHAAVLHPDWRRLIIRDIASADELGDLGGHEELWREVARHMAGGEA